MARLSFKVTKFKDHVDGSGNPAGTAITLGGNGAPVTTFDYSAVATDIATLVADGASPTQAHVTTLNTDWGTLKTSLDAVAAENGDVYVSFDTTKITTRAQLKAALDAVLINATGSGMVTP